MSFSDDSRPERLADDAAPLLDDDQDGGLGEHLKLHREALREHSKLHREAMESAQGDSELLAENEQLREQALRYAAEAENTKRRAEREANDARAYAIQRFGRDLLGAADNLSRALQAVPQSDDPAVKNFVLGIEMTARELESAFDKNGLKKVEPRQGEKFDPNLHQAMMEEPASGVAGGAVVRTLQPGYSLHGRIVRPALVVTAARGAAADAQAAPPAQAEGATAYAQTEGAGAGAAVDRRA